MQLRQERLVFIEYVRRHCSPFEQQRKTLPRWEYRQANETQDAEQDKQHGYPWLPLPTSGFNLDKHADCRFSLGPETRG